MNRWTVRPEADDDAAAIGVATVSAFTTSRHGYQGEAELVQRLRDAGDLALSLVVEADGVIGHVAFSPVTISDGSCGWLGLAPLSVMPEWQGRGIGAALVAAGLARLKEQGANGCVVLGDPGYYGRFGFRHDPALAYSGPPARLF